MGSGHLFGWESVGEDWVKVVCNPSGELLIDASLIFEDVPSDGELEKAPTSNWAYDHKADAAAHHARYTDVESRAAISDVFLSNGRVSAGIHMNYQDLSYTKSVWLLWDSAAVYRARMFSLGGAPEIRFNMDELGVGYIDMKLALYKTDHYVYVIDEANFQDTLALYLEGVPSDGEIKKAPTSKWAYDHNANASAHHAKYTDAAAQQACNLDGDLYYSMAGTNFRPTNPDVDDHHYGVDGKLVSDRDGMSVYAPVMLPDGCTVTAVLVDGSAGLTDEYWTLYQIAHSDQTNALVAQALVQVEDVSISNEVIDNSLYSYIISVVSMDTADELYYARIKYTL